MCPQASKNEHALLQKAFDGIDADHEADKATRKARRMAKRIAPSRW